MKRNTLPIALIFLFVSPVFAWTIDGVCDGGVENSTVSPDCALSVSNISELYSNTTYYTDNYIRLNATTLYSAGKSQQCSRLILSGADSYCGISGSDWCWKIVDSTTSLSMYAYGGDYGTRTVLANTTIPSFDGKIVEFVGYYFDTQTGGTPLCSGIIYCPYDMLFEVYNATIIGDFSGEIPIVINEELIGSGHINEGTATHSLFKFNIDSTALAYAYTRYNSTHRITNRMLLETYSLFELNSSYFHTTTNFTYSLYGLNIVYGTVYWNTPSIDLYENLNISSTKTLIAKGYLANQSVGCTGTYSEYIDFVNLNSPDSYNIIGNGVCEELESYVPTDWNYDSQCELDRYGSITGFALASSGKTITGVLLVVIMIGFIGLLGYSSKEGETNYVALIIMVFFIIALLVAGLSMLNTW